MATLMVLLFLLSQAASELTEVKVGQEVTLPCQAGDGSIRAVEWTRHDLKPSEYVLFYSDGHFDTADQNPSFKGRVKLVNNEMKDGDMSLILRKVNSSDEGTYECRVAPGGSRRNKRAIIKSPPIKTITLKVTGPQSGDTDMDVDMIGHHNHVGLIPGVLVCLAVVVVGSFAVWKSKKQQNSEPPAAVEASGVQLV